MSKTLYDIIIPHANVSGSEAFAYQCVRTIQQHSQDFRLIWIQNGERVPDSIQGLFASAKHELLVQLNEFNEGFLKATNSGLKLATADHVVLMNNDTEAVPGWLEKLRAPLRWPVVMSGPRTTTPHSWQGQVPPGTGARLISTRSMLAFFCVMMDRRLLDIVGLLDEDFGVGFGDDDNYCARVHAAGLHMVLVEDLVIPHKHRSTFKAIYGEDRIKEMQREALKLHFNKLDNLLK